MNIEVGEYVRTKDGIIAKVTDVLNEYCIDCDDDVFDLENAPMMEIPWEYIEDYIVKHSKDLIDLIEIGDYANGYKVIAKTDDGYIEILTEDIEQGELLEEQDIKTILTKELYKANCYTVIQ